MLFNQDLFSVFWQPKNLETKLSEITDAVARSTELVNSENWIEAREITRKFIEKELAENSGSALYQQLFAIAATCESFLAIQEDKWSLAADWLYTGMMRCDEEEEPYFNNLARMPYRYLLVCAAMASDEKVLSYEPSQLHVQLTEEAFKNLVIAYVRLSAFGKSRLDEGVSGVANLRNRIQEHLQNNFGTNNKRRKAETKIVDLVYQKSSSLFRNIQIDCQLIQQSNSLSNIKENSSSLLRSIAQGQVLLLSEEASLIEALRNILGGKLSVLIKISEADDPYKTREESKTFSSYIENVIPSFKYGGILARGICFPFIQHLLKINDQSVELLASEVSPDVILDQEQKRYPLDSVGETLRLQIEVVNIGKGKAIDCSCHFETSSKKDIELLEELPISIHEVAPGQSKNIQFRLCLNAVFDTISIPIFFEFYDILGNKFSKSENLIIERQRDEPDWDKLLLSAPYSLRPIASVEKLRGRKTELNTLKINSVSSSTVLWGQRRVGKTSIAQVFEKQLSSREGYLSVYVKRGEISGYSEGKIARLIVSKIIRYVPQLRLELPDESWFGPNFTRLTEWLYEARSCGLQQKLVIIFDEFDDINTAIYLGPRGDNFFATLRSLSEKEIVWIFVGGERMPAIFERHHATLNQVEVFRVDRISDPRNIEEMVSDPVRGQIDWAPKAIELIRHLTAGNPYFVQLICGRVLKQIYPDHRTFVDKSDVSFIADAITSEDTPSHWGHFWEDNSGLEEVDRLQKSSLAALFLASLGESLKENESQSVNFSDLLSVARTFDVDDDDVIKLRDTATELVRRGVIQETSISKERFYQATIPIFGIFLRKHGKSVVFPFCKQYKSTIEQKFSQSRIPEKRFVSVASSPYDFPVDEEELIAISEGLVYQTKRVDPIHLRNWLRQFSNEEDILIAAKLLRRLKDKYYIDSARIGHAIDSAYKWLQNKMNETERQTFMFAGTSGQAVKKGGRIVNVHIAYYGSASKSGADIAREFKTQKRFARCSSIDDALKWVKDTRVPIERKFILIVDDFVGSGSQARDALYKVANKIRKDEVLDTFAKQGRILFSPLWAFADGIDLVMADLDDIIIARPSYTLDDEDRAFSETCDLYADDEERQFAEAVFRHIGEQLQPQNPLGHSNNQALVMFENTIPNNTLPAFWSSGFVDEKSWEPLFQRP